MRNHILIALVCLLAISCNQSTETENNTLEYSLLGYTDIGDSLVISMYDRLTGELIDSAMVLNDSFRFEGTLASNPHEVILYNLKSRSVKYIWLEPGEMTFTATKGFHDARMTGSETQYIAAAMDSMADTITDRERQMKQYQLFVKNHPNSPVSASCMEIYASTWGKPIVEQLFIDFSDKNKASEYGKRIQRYIDLVVEPSIGDKYIDFEMPDIHGEQVRLSDKMGKLTLLEFWSSWCGPCRRENPNLVNTYNKFHPQGFEIFAISLDNEKDDWVKAIEKDSLNWTHVSNLSSVDSDPEIIYGINRIPYNYLIDENGIIIAERLRGEALDSAVTAFMEIM